LLAALAALAESGFCEGRAAGAGGADERLDPPAELAREVEELELCFEVALTWLLRAFLGGILDAREDALGVLFGVLLVGIFTSSHPSPFGALAWPAHAVVESM
jgi:hypothetical protein